MKFFEKIYIPSFFPITYLLTYLLAQLLHCTPFRCVNYGVLPTKKAVKLFSIVTERKKQQRTGGMATSFSSPKKKKAKFVKEAAVDPGLQSSGPEGVGSAVL